MHRLLSPVVHLLRPMIEEGGEDRYEQTLNLLLSCICLSGTWSAGLLCVIVTKLSYDLYGNYFIVRWTWTLLRWILSKSNNIVIVQLFPNVNSIDLLILLANCLIVFLFYFTLFNQLFCYLSGLNQIDHFDGTVFKSSLLNAEK